MSRSLYLIGECQRQGLLSNEYAGELLEQREELIKQAMKKEAMSLFKTMRAADPTKPGFARSFLSKLKIGGRTPAKIGKGGTEEVVAKWSDVAANLGKMMALAGMTAGATAGIGGILRHSRDKKIRAEIDTSYKKMFSEYPRLKELEEEESGRVRRHFGVLARYAPSLAADPVVAGSWVTDAAQRGGSNLADIKALAETQRRIDDAREERGVMKMAPMKASELATKAMMV